MGWNVLEDMGVNGEDEKGWRIWFGIEDVERIGWGKLEGREIMEMY